MRKHDEVLLHDMLTAVDAIKRFTSGTTYSHFAANEMMHQAVIRELEIIGEAARSVSDALQDAQPEIAWAQIVGMRNRLIHAYSKVDLGIVWEIVQIDLPVLEQQVKRILGEEVQ